MCAHIYIYIYIYIYTYTYVDIYMHSCLCVCVIGSGVWTGSVRIHITRAAISTKDIRATFRMGQGFYDSSMAPGYELKGHVKDRHPWPEATRSASLPPGHFFKSR